MSRQAASRTLYSAQDWKERLQDAVANKQKVVFVVGAGISWDGQGGVWGVSEIVKHASALCGGVPAEGSADGYQSILDTLKRKKGPSAVEQMVRRAVLAAAKDGEAKQKALREIDAGASVHACRALQEDIAAWYLPKGVRALAELVGMLMNAREADEAGSCPCVLSTNFDGLVEVALSRRKIHHESIVVAGDTFLRGLGQKPSVVHLHGFWRDQPTLHSPEALQEARPLLARSLHALLEGAQVFVLGYGGWNDIFLDTLSGIFQHQAANQLPALAWAFFEPGATVRENQGNPESPVGHVLNAFSKSTTAISYSGFYCGVDAHRDLPEVAQALRKPSARSRHDIRRERLGEPSANDTLADGRYVLNQKLGHGGFATVWKARDHHVPDESAPDAWVAIKVMHAHMAGDSVAADRFARGARIMAELDHPGIVRIIEPRCEDYGRLCFVMELLTGGTFRAAVREGRIKAPESLHMILTVAEALAVAHQRGYVHRDVKPANVLLTAGGQPKLSDFDLVGGGDTTGGTRTAAALGSFAYAAPECLGRAQDARPSADVFSLGMMLVFALQGDDPHPYTMDRKHRNLPCSEAIKQVIRKATDVSPERRHSDASAFAADLERALGAEDAGTSASSRTSRGDAGPGAPPLPDWATGGGQDEFGTFAELELALGVTTRMRWIWPGEFWMGSPEDEPGRFGDEGPRHKVILSKGFWLADAPCTQAEWKVVMDTEPSQFRGSNLPVESVSWDECRAFCNRLRTRFPGMTPRLPTEAEWELACRAGTTSAFNESSPCTEPDGKDAALAKLGWFRENSARKTHEVRSLEPNRWGLYDMHGNVWEWCEDFWGTYTPHEQVDPTGPDTGDGRVIRGGAWGNAARSCRSACRCGGLPFVRNHDVGFRLASGQ